VHECGRGENDEYETKSPEARGIATFHASPTRCGATVAAALSMATAAMLAVLVAVAAESAFGAVAKSEPAPKVGTVQQEEEERPALSHHLCRQPQCIQALIARSPSASLYENEQGET